MPGQSSPFNVNYNESKTVGPLAFVARAVGVDNPTPFYIHFPDGSFGSWVRPFYGGVVVPGPTADKSIRVSSLDAPLGAQAPTVAPASGIFAACMAFEDAQPYSPGYPLGSTNHINAFPLLSRGVATYTFQIQMPTGAKGLIAYLRTNAGGGGSAQMQIENSDGVLGGSTDLLVQTGVLAAGSSGNLYVYPGIAAVTNVAFSGVLGSTPTIVVTVTTAAVVFGVDYDLLF